MSARKNPEYPAIFDVIIIGGGPAGMTAAVYAARRKMKALILTGKTGGQMMWSSDIENYTGVAKVTGPELTKIFMEHVHGVDEDNSHFDLWVREHEMVSSVKKEDNLFVVETDKQSDFETPQTFLARTLVLTTGKVPRTLNIPGEDIAMKGNGLSFCATCDAPLYKDKKMVIVGGGNSAMDVALQLSKFTNNITIFTNLDHLIGEGCLMDKIEQNDNISVEYLTKTQEILLDASHKVSGIRYVQDGEEKTYACEGIFEEIGQIPATAFLEGFVDLNAKKEIVTDRNKRTSVPGVFAGGDCTDQTHKQVIVAAGEGAVAALEAHEYLLRKEDFSYA